AMRCVVHGAVPQGPCSPSRSVMPPAARGDEPHDDSPPPLAIRTAQLPEPLRRRRAKTSIHRYIISGQLRIVKGRLERRRTPMAGGAKTLRDRATPATKELGPFGNQSEMSLATSPPLPRRILGEKYRSEHD